MAPSPKIVLATWGSLGDLHPFIAIALRLRQSGMEPVIATVGEYRSKVEAEGLSFHEVRPSLADLERELGATLPEITRQVTARPDWLFRKLVFPYLRQSYDDMMSATADADLLVTSSVAIAARLAAEKREMPWIGAVFQPIAFLSAFDSPTLLTGGWVSGTLRRLGPAASRLTLAALKRLSALLAKPVHDFRQEIGLPRTHGNPVLEGQFSTRGSLALYSPVFGNVQPDFPPRTVITGFPFYDHELSAADPPDAALAQFLAAGPSPIVFTLGSTFVRTPGTFYRNSLLAARKLGRRAVLLVGETSRNHFEDALFDEAFVCRYAPYSQLFPHAAAIVHQGGIGTLGQGLRAACPQLIVPYFGDQPDNAARAVRLGVARTLSRGHYNVARASQELEKLLNMERYTSRARAVSQHIAHEDGAGEATRAIRNFAEDIRELE